MTDDLASGFQSVDHASDFEVFSNCLTLIDPLPFFVECKRESYDLLGATPGHRILEVGCGLGDDAAALARRVAPGGSRADAHCPERLVRPLPVGLDRSPAGPAVSSVRPS